MSPDSAHHQMRIKLDRTLCDGFGVCAKHAPEYFSLDDWGYAVLVGDGNIPEADRDAVMRALMDCPAHAIMEIADHRTSPPLPPSPTDEDPGEHLKTQGSEAEWGFTR